MALKLVERKYVKDILGINRADTVRDDEIEGLIAQVSEDVESECRREFDKRERTEYHASYDQNVFDPMPQFIKLKAYPLDVGERLSIVYSATSDRDWETCAIRP